MAFPPKGEGGAKGTFNIAQIVLSDEEEFYNSKSAQNLTSNLMEIVPDSNKCVVNKENFLSTTTKTNDDSPQKNKPVKLFSLDSDKYYYSDNIFVFVEKTNTDNIGRLHPLVVGHILHKKLCVKNIISIKSAGRNRIKIQLKTINDANLLVNNNALESENLRAFIPNHLLEKKGVIRGVDTYFDNNYLKENIICPTKVLDVQRMQRKTSIDNKAVLIPKQTVIITFQGNLLPNEIVINSVLFPVETFYGKVTQCFNCLKYGHISKQCRNSTSLCINCAKPRSDNHECHDKDIFCIHCKSNDHKSNAKNCPTFEKQKKIKKIMIDNNASFAEAKQYCDNSFASFTSNNRFDILSDLSDYDTNFPKISNQDSTVPNNIFSLSQSRPRRVSSFNKQRATLSQPCTSRNYLSKEVPSNSTKKRKINPTSPIPSTSAFNFQSQNPELKRPYCFRAPNPMPKNSNFPLPNGKEDKNKIIDCLSKFIINFLGNLESLNDLKKFNVDIIKQKMNLALEEGISPNQILSNNQ